MIINWWMVGWLILGLAAFAYEMLAIFNKTNRDTLSEQVWQFLGFYSPNQDGVWLRRFLFCAFWLWATLHFLFQIS